MNEQLTNQEALPNDMEEAQATENDISMDVTSGAESGKTETKSKLTKKKITIIAAGIVAAAALAVIFLIPSEFERVRKECEQMGIEMTYSDDYFTLDTYTYENWDSDVLAFVLSANPYLLDETQEKTLKAIKHANSELGFNNYLYTQMLNTTALMGRQSAETDKYRASWTYHPDEGLEVAYEKK